MQLLSYSPFFFLKQWVVHKVWCSGACLLEICWSDSNSLWQSKFIIMIRTFWLFLFSYSLAYRQWITVPLSATSRTSIHFRKTYWKVWRSSKSMPSQYFPHQNIVFPVRSFRKWESEEFSWKQLLNYAQHCPFTLKIIQMQWRFSKLDREY